MSAIEPSYRYIVRTPGVRGGHARVEGTRIGVHDVIGLLQNGKTVTIEEIEEEIRLRRARGEI